MNTKFDFTALEQNIVYVKPILVAELPDEVRKQVGDMSEVYAVHNAAGEQLALVANRKMAFHLARENNLEPVTVH